MLEWVVDVWIVGVLVILRRESMPNDAVNPAVFAKDVGTPSLSPRHSTKCKRCKGFGRSTTDCEIKKKARKQEAN